MVPKIGRHIPPELVHLPRGGHKKGINKEYMDFSPNFSLEFRVLKLRFLAFSEGPGRFREVREASRNYLHLPWYARPLIVVIFFDLSQYVGGLKLGSIV